MGELIFEAVIAILAAVMFGMSFSFKESLIDQSGGPALFPRIVIILLLLFLAVRAAVVLRSEEERKKDFRFLEIFKGSRLIFLAMFIVYVLLVKPAGFLLATWIFVLFTLPYLYKKQYGRSMGAKRQAITSVISVAGVFLLYILFSRYFNVWLPTGILKI